MRYGRAVVFAAVLAGAIAPTMAHAEGITLNDQAIAQNQTMMAKQHAADEAANALAIAANREAAALANAGVSQSTANSVAGATLRPLQSVSCADVAGGSADVRALQQLPISTTNMSNDGAIVYGTAQAAIRQASADVANALAIGQNQSQLAFQDVGYSPTVASSIAAKAVQPMAGATCTSTSLSNAASTTPSVP